MVVGCLFEDEGFSKLYPLTHFKPVFELVCGMKSLRARAFQHMGSGKPHYLCRSHLKPTLMERLGLDASQVNSLPSNQGVLLVNGRTVMDNELFSQIDSRREEVGLKDGVIVYANLTPQTLNGLTDVLNGEVNTASLLERLDGRIPTRGVSATLVEFPWDLVNLNPELLRRDLGNIHESTGPGVTWTKEIDDNGRTNVTNSFNGTIMDERDIIGDLGNLHLGANAVIGPGATINLKSGPIYIGENVTIKGPTRIEGPFYVGPDTQIHRAEIHPGTRIGRNCRIAGELDQVVIEDFVNKAHQGHLGHAYACEWVNIGAGTINSNLSNNYGPVKVTINGQEVNTGLLKVGCFIGDHSKIAIGTLINTGSVIGPFCNVYGAGLQQRYIPGFSWGGTGGLVEHRIEKALETAGKVMPRRGVQLTGAYEELIRKVQDETKQTA